jgi:hypothetical protein
MAADLVAPQVAHEVLWMTDLADIEAGIGHRPGSYVESLLTTIRRASPANRELLRLAYPGYVAAFEMLAAPAGLQRLTAIARGEEIRERPSARLSVRHELVGEGPGYFHIGYSDPEYPLEAPEVSAVALEALRVYVTDWHHHTGPDQVTWRGGPFGGRAEQYLTMLLLDERPEVHRAGVEMAALVRWTRANLKAGDVCELVDGTEAG